MMITGKRLLSRRTVLRGVGTTLALPLFECMAPSVSAWENAPAGRPKRLAIVYVPNGMVMENWTPPSDGSGFTLTPILQPLSQFRDRLVVVTGLNNSDSANRHETGSTKFLTCRSPKPTQGGDLLAGVSADQVAAQAFRSETQLGSLEVALDVGEFGGTCGGGYSCAYTNTISWRTPSTPLPMETNPRAVFERLLGDGGSTDPAARLVRIRNDRSVLDAVLDKVFRLRHQLGADDRAKLEEFSEAVRDAERRLRLAEKQRGELPNIPPPAGTPDSFEGQAKLMFDLQVIGFQTDMTRVITFMMGREFSGLTYPELGVSEAHHPLSHHQGDPEKLAKLTKIQAFHASLFAYYLSKLSAVREGDRTLLEQMLVLYGGGLSDSDKHLSDNLPVLVVGGAVGSPGGRHLRYPDATPMADLHLSLLRALDVPVKRFADSTGPLPGLIVG